MLKRAIAAGVAGLMMASFAIGAERFLVKKETDVKLRFAQKLSSKTAKVGDKVKLEVDEDLVVNGHTIVKEGTPVIATIEKVKKRERYGVNAEIRLDIKTVKSVDGKIIDLQPKTEGERVDGQKTGEAAAATVGGAILLGPIGLVGGYFVVGKNVEAKPGDKLTSEVAKDTWVNVR